MVAGPVKPQNGIRFGEDFELDVQTCTLRRAGRVLKLERIPMEVLLLLIEQRARIVSREQIAERVWGKATFLDTDNSINGVIRKIRRVLRDDSSQPRFIGTIPGQGYRFIASVTEDEPDMSPPPVSAPRVEPPLETETVGPTAATNGPLPSYLAQSRPARGIISALLVLVLVVAALAGWKFWPLTQPRPEHSSRRMLAVLPLENLTGDPEQEYLSQGFTEEMITQLGNVNPQHLGVIARTSVMQYRNKPVALDQIARELGVQYIVEGSIRRDTSHVRVTAQLINTRNQAHVWAHQYDRELKDLHALQTEIAQEIADEVQLALGDEKRTMPSRASLSPAGYEAYDAYLKGQYFVNQRRLPQATQYFEQATAKDPRNAPAYAALADCYLLLPGYTGVPQAEYAGKARQAALKALAIDENLPEAHSALALLVQNYDWDWVTAEKEFRRAIELNPNYATGYHWYAEHLMWRGRFDEALRASERARQLDPLSLVIASDNGAILYYRRDYEGAIGKWQSVLDIDPEFPRAQIMAAYAEAGRTNVACRPVGRSAGKRVQPADSGISAPENRLSSHFSIRYRSAMVLRRCSLWLGYLSFSPPPPHPTHLSEPVHSGRRRSSGPSRCSQHARRPRRNPAGVATRARGLCCPGATSERSDSGGYGGARCHDGQPARAAEVLRQAALARFGYSERQS